jgi:hypothetical protein
MSFPTNWGQDAANRLARIAQRTVRLAMEQEGTWTTSLARLRATVRRSAGYEAATAGQTGPADTDGRCLALTAPHFEIRVGPGAHWRPAGAIFYRSRPEQAARVLKDEWGSDIFFELSPQEAQAVAEEILGPLGDSKRTPAAVASGRVGMPT